MATVTFDTLKFVETLEAAQLTREQARAIAAAVSTAVRDAYDSADVATKGDVHRLDTRLEKLDTKVDLLKWMLGFLVAGVLSLMVKAFL